MQSVADRTVLPERLGQYILCITCGSAALRNLHVLDATIDRRINSPHISAIGPE